MNKAFRVIGSLIAISIATPSVALEGAHIEADQAIADCQAGIRANLPHPDSVRWLGHAIYHVEPGSHEFFVRIGYMAMDESGHMRTQTTDCPIG